MRKPWMTSEAAILRRARTAKEAARQLPHRSLKGIRDAARRHAVGFGRKRVVWDRQAIDLALQNAQRAAQQLGCSLHNVHCAVSRYWQGKLRVKP